MQDGDFVTIENSVVRTRPTGTPFGDALDFNQDELRSSVDRAFEKLSKPASSTAAIASISPSKTQTVPKNLGWRANSKGWWLFSDTPELQELVRLLRAQPKKTIVIGSYRYSLTGESDRFVNRWIHKTETAQ